MKNIKKSLLLLLTPLAIYAGSNDAIIECKSGTGRTALKFLDQDITGSFQGGTFTIDKKSIKYLPQYDGRTGKSNSYSWMIVDMKEGVYTLVYNDKKNSLDFYALPKSMKKVNKEGIDTFYQFNAIVDWRSTDPRSLSPLRKKICLSCTMSYSI